MVDPDFAKRQLELLTREWYMHPTAVAGLRVGFRGRQPPVHAWRHGGFTRSKLDVRHSRPRLPGRGVPQTVAQFHWWVNRKDADGRNVFQGGFLGLDNISLFDRSARLPTGGHIDQSDGTAWMAFYCWS